MAARYGLPAAELQARLSTGRFRVKANVDRATAEAYARDLVTLGARVRIEEAQATARRTPAPAARPETASVVRTSPAIVVRPTSTTAASLPPQPGPRPTQSSLPPQPGTRPTQSSLPPQPRPRPTQSSLPPQPTQSSLPPQPGPAHRAHHVPATGEPDVTPGGAAPAQLGALDRGGELSLASLAPLHDEAPAEAAAFAPPVDMPASIGPAAVRPAADPAHPRTTPLDRFAPPDADPADAVMELADDELEHRARKRMTAPRIAAPEPVAGPGSASYAVTSEPVARRGSTSHAASAEPVAHRGSTSHAASVEPVAHRASGPPTAPSEPSARRAPGPPTAPAEPVARRASASRAVAPGAAQDSIAPDAAEPAVSSQLPIAAGPTRPRGVMAPELLGSPRVRFAAGVALAVVLGFVPAHLVAALRERSVLRAVDDKVAEVQAAADSQQRYDALDEFRRQQLDRKRSERRTIVVTAMAIWAAASGGLAYVWFRRVPWDRLG